MRANRKQRTFHIDSGATVMHCKALTEADFDRWTAALKTFIIQIVNEGPLVGHSEGAGAQGSAYDGDLGSVRASVNKMRSVIPSLLSPL